MVEMQVGDQCERKRMLEMQAVIGTFVIRFEKPMLRILKKNRRCAHKDQSFGFTWFKAVSMKVLKIPLSSR